MLNNCKLQKQPKNTNFTQRTKNCNKVANNLVEENHSKNKSSQSNKHKKYNQKPIINKQKSLLSKASSCFKKLISKLCPQEKQNVYIINQEKLLEFITNLKQKNDDNAPYLPPIKQNKKTLVLQLEGALVFSSRQKMNGCSFSTIVEWQGSQIEIFYKTRPGLYQFMAQMGKLYELVIFTSSPRAIADAILSHIDKNRAVQHCIYRDKCLNLNQIYYLKDMRKLNRNPSKVVFVDCNVATGVMQPLNFFQISRFVGCNSDIQLNKLNKFLTWLSYKDQVTPIFKNFQIFFESVLQKNSQMINKKIFTKMQIKNAHQTSASMLKSKHRNEAKIIQDIIKLQQMNLSSQNQNENYNEQYMRTKQTRNPVFTQQNLSENEDIQTINQAPAPKGQSPPLIFQQIQDKPEVIDKNYQFLKNKIKQISRRHKRLNSDLLIETVLKKVKSQQFGKTKKVLQTGL